MRGIVEQVVAVDVGLLFQCFGERKRTELLIVIFYEFVQCPNRCDAVYYIYNSKWLIRDITLSKCSEGKENSYYVNDFIL